VNGFKAGAVWCGLEERFEVLRAVFEVLRAVFEVLRAVFEVLRAVFEVLRAVFEAQLEAAEVDSPVMIMRILRNIGI
jgi:hypothetical protein